MVDAQEIRERLAADGHAEAEPERARVRVVNTCCVTAEAVAKSRKAVRRAARDGAERVLVTGCARQPARRRVRRCGGQRDRRCRGAPSETPGGRRGLGGRAGLRGRRCAAVRAHARLRQDPGRLLVRVQLLRDPAGARRQPQPRRRGRARRGRPPGRAGPPRAGPDRHQPRAASATGRPGCDLADLLAARSRGVDGIERVRLSSIEVNHLTDALLDAVARHPRVAPHLHVPHAVGRRRRAAGDAAPLHGGPVPGRGRARARARRRAST